VVKGKDSIDLLGDLKKELLKLDPVFFAQNYLMIDGHPFGLSGGWKFWQEIYRNIAISAFRKDSKPIVLLKGRQVSATNMATAMEMYFAASGICGNKNSPPVRIVHCFPDLGKVQKFSKLRLADMIRSSVGNYIQKQLYGYTEDGKKTQEDTSIQNLKQFKNGSYVMVESNANDGARLQSTTNDIILYDEMQHMFDSDIGNANRTLTASNYGPIGQGTQIYFGTPLQKGSYFWKVWEASDQRFYHLRCVKCAEYFQLYEYGSDSWEQIWVSGTTVCCPHCSHLQNKSDAVSGGKWVASKNISDDGQEPRFAGYHINQLLLPYLTKEAVIQSKPGVQSTNTDRVWKNEILGEFYSGYDLPMSEDIIYNKCRELDRSLSFGIVNSNEVNTFLGIDWGDKTSEDSKGQSYTTFVVCSVDATGTMRVLNAFKLKKNNIQHKKDVVDEMFRRFSIKVAVADLGHGNDIVPEIQRQYGARFIGCFNSASLVNPYKYDAEELRLMCNSNIVLEEVFSLMRKGKVLFPWADFEKISWVIEDVCSMEKETKVSNGQVFNKFVKGTGPNDSLMSIMYCYLAYKFFLTRGFSVKPHQLGGKQAGAILAHIPRI
jgi:hypothetical protein